MKLKVLILILLFSSSAYSAEIKLINANPSKGFSYPYVLRIPTSTIPKKYALIVETNNTGRGSDIFSEHKEKVLTEICSKGIGPKISKNLGYPLLVPIFPRPGKDKNIYTHALDEDTLKIVDGPMKRLDLQLLAMVRHAKEVLNKYEFEIPKKFVMVGFSASGTFANRIAFIHPNELIAIAYGGINSVPTLPLEKYDNTDLPYPVGISNLKTLTGKNVQLDQWKKIPQYIFMGAKDDNDAVKFDNAFTRNNRELVFFFLGENMNTRWFSAQKIYIESGSNSTLVTFGGVGHWTNTRINEALASFVKYHVDRHKQLDIKNLSTGRVTAHPL